MSSTWRKKEQFKTKSSPNPIMESFSNIPMLDVLKNIPDENKNMIKKLADEKKVEGFDLNEGFDGGGGSFEWQGMDYYHHHNVFKLYDYSKIKEYVAKLMGYVSYPLTNFDSMLEQYIYDILSTCFLIEIDNCDDKQRSIKNRYKQAADNMFFWIDAKKQDEGHDEGFSLKEQPNLFKTIKSFQTNHPNFIKDATINNKVGVFYMNRLNKYETKLHRRLRDDELFEFNNQIDNLLNDPNIQKQILNLNVMHFDDEFQPKSEYTESGYKKYYDAFARFKIENTADNIDYHDFDVSYFPFNAVFDNALKHANDMLIQLTPEKLKEYHANQNISDTSFRTVNDSPPSTNVDTNYVFSITSTESKGTIQEYLKHVIKYFSLIVFEKKYVSDENKFSFQEIEARVGTTYTNCLNRLEFVYHNTYGLYLDVYNIAIFNHIFYILMKQDKAEAATNPYNAITNKYVKIADDSATDNKILAKDIFTRFMVANNKRYSLLPDSNDDLKIPIVGVELNPFVDVVNSNEIASDEQYLQDYILTETFSKSEEMEKYYIPLSECEWHKTKDRKNAHKNLSKFAKIIKNEIYRILMIPVLLYLVYNIYYMFFFIDYVDPPKPNSNGAPYVETCKYPIFPDWENEFHYHEKHKTDFLFEYMFKPTKIIYTWLNMIKTFIRTFPMIGLIASQKKANFIRIPPYIYFFATIVLFYHTLDKYGNSFLNFYISFFKTLSVPFVKIIKDPNRDVIKLLQLEGKIEGNWLGYSEIGTIIIFLFMALSFIKDNTGWDVVNIIANLLCGIPKTSEENKKTTWIEWFATTPTVIITIFKAIVWILYWLFKFYISLAMVPIANIIAIIYVGYTMIFAIYDSTKNYSSKKDLINNIIYTELYDIPDSDDRKFLPIYVYKTICWLLMVFIMEIISVYVLLTGLKNITSNITNSGDGNYAEQIKMVLIPTYATLIVLIALWCVHKYKFKIPMMSSSYNKDKITNQMNDKRVDAKGCTNYDTTAENNPLNFMDTFSVKCIIGTLFGSDYINNLIIKQEMHEKNKPTKESKYMNDLFDLLARKGDDYIKKMDESVTNLSKNTELKKNISNGMTNLATNLKGYGTRFSDGATIMKNDIGKQASGIVNGIENKFSGFSGITKKKDNHVESS